MSPGMIDVEFLSPSLSVWELRIAMAQRGWASSLKVSGDGWGRDESGAQRFSLSIAFERWEWHGVRMDRISFGDRTRANPTLEEALLIIRRAARLALEAWERFPNAVPEQTMNGELRADALRGAHFTSKDFPGEWVPSELLPDPSEVGRSDGNVSLFLELARSQVWSEDDLDHLGWNSPSTLQGRKWGYEVNLRPVLWQGVRLMPYSFSYYTKNLTGSLVEGLARHAASEMKSQEEAGVWLPGMQSIEEAVRDMELGKRLEEGLLVEEGAMEIAEMMERRMRRWRESRTLQRLFEEPGTGLATRSAASLS